MDFFHPLLCGSTLCELSRSSTPIRSSSWPFSGENQVLLRFRIRQQNCSIIRGVDIDFIVSQTSKLSLTTHLFHEKPQDLPQSDVSLFLNAVNGLYFGIMILQSECGKILSVILKFTALIGKQQNMVVISPTFPSVSFNF